MNGCQYVFEYVGSTHQIGQTSIRSLSISIRTAFRPYVFFDELSSDSTWCRFWWNLLADNSEWQFCVWTRFFAFAVWQFFNIYFAEVQTDICEFYSNWPEGCCRCFSFIPSSHGCYWIFCHLAPFSSIGDRPRHHPEIKAVTWVITALFPSNSTPTEKLTQNSNYKGKHVRLSLQEAKIKRPEMQKSWIFNLEFKVHSILRQEARKNDFQLRERLVDTCCLNSFSFLSILSTLQFLIILSPTVRRAS